MYRNPIRRRRSSGGGGMLPGKQLLMAVGLGVGTAVGLGYAGPRVAAYFNQPVAGLAYRGIQAAVVVGASWAARKFGLLSSATANTLTMFGLTFVGLGVYSDYQSGLLSLSGSGAAPASGMGPGNLRAYENETYTPGSLGYYEQAMGAVPYGVTAPAMGYYEAVA